MAAPAKSETQAEAEAEAEAELLADFRPGYTIWRHRLRDLDVLVVQGEGGELLEEDVCAGIESLRGAIAASRHFATFYDLTEGMTNLMPHAPKLLRFASEMRSSASERQRCTVAVCPNERTRNWVRWMLGLASQGISAHVVQSTAEGWVALGQQEEEEARGSEALLHDSFGAEAALPLTLLSQPSLLTPDGF
jgi:hypothetical protein